MNVKEAVSSAKDYVLHLLAEEGVQNIGLEEVEFEPADGTWNITVGFSRPWNTRNALMDLAGATGQKRSYRIVKVKDDDGTVLSLKRREMTD